MHYCDPNNPDVDNMRDLMLRGSFCAAFNPKTYEPLVDNVKALGDNAGAFIEDTATSLQNTGTAIQQEFDRSKHLSLGEYLTGKTSEILAAAHEIDEQHRLRSGRVPDVPRQAVAEGENFLMGIFNSAGESFVAISAGAQNLILDAVAHVAPEDSPYGRKSQNNNTQFARSGP